MFPTVVTPPPVEPVSLDEAKAFARVTYDPADPIAPLEDALILRAITSARQSVETRTDRALITTTFDWTLDSWPMAPMLAGLRYVQSLNMPPVPLSEIRPTRATLIAVTSINYYDPAGNLQLLDPSAYQVLAGTPGRIIPAYGRAWPALRSWPGSVTIRYIAGYGPTAASVPACVIQALLMMTAGWYENREWQTPTGNNFGLVPETVDALLAPIMWGAYE
ncbi:unnamed protein product [uncultured bacterium]|nr:unnamed protein product [uncultured bacterium]